ncbi:MAG: TetR/AcrR family transcriptional regulator [Pseudomonadota bacterium]
MPNPAGPTATGRAKDRPYHHGDLREALLDAAHKLLGEKGVEGFTLADACRLAGVSTAAPYRHFSDRDAVLDALVSRGFQNLEAAMRARAEGYTEGSIDRIVAIGQAYVAFAVDEPALFRVMFRRPPEHDPTSPMALDGDSCFGAVLEALTALQEQRGLKSDDLLDLAMPLWAVVHGVANLMIDGAFERKAPGVDAEQLIDRTTRRFFAGLGAVS